MAETSARITFLRNMTRMGNLANALRETKGLEEELAKQQARQAAGKHTSNIERLQQRLEKRKAGLLFLYEWQAVMFVTFTETYLQDVLAACAGVDSKLMNNVDQTASFTDIENAESLEELAHELRSRWARNFVDRGGPPKWIERLKKMGAKGYSPNLGEIMKQLWGVRNLIVHRAGIANRNFITRHPEFNLKLGMQIKLTNEKLSAYASAIHEFVSNTDIFFVKAYPTSSA